MIKTKKGKMERIIKFTPAFDKRNPDPEKNYGIHGVELLFLLKGPEGAVQFNLFTNWHLPHVQEELNAEAVNKGVSYARAILNPMPAGLDYHSPKPLHKGQTMLRAGIEKP